MRWRILIWLIFLWMVLFLSRLGTPRLLDPAETAYALTALEIRTGAEAPSSHILSFLYTHGIILGDDLELTFRFPSALAAILLGIAIFWMGSYLGEERLATFWALLATTSLLPLFLSRMALPHQLVNLVIFLALAFLFRHLRDRAWLWLFLAALASVYAFATAGILAPLTIILTWLIATAMEHKRSDAPSTPAFWLSLGLYLLFVALTLGLWVGVEWLQNNTSSFFHRTIPQLMRLQLRTPSLSSLLLLAAVLTLGLFPANLIALGRLFHLGLGTSHKRLRWNNWMLIFFLLSGLLFFIYTPPFSLFPLMAIPLSYFAAEYLDFLSRTRTQKQLPYIPRWLSGIYLFFVLFIGLGLVILPLLGILAPRLLTFIRNPFWQEALQAPVLWEIPLVFLGLTFIVGHIVITQSYRGEIVKWAVYTTLLNGIIFFLTHHFYYPKLEYYWQGSLIDFYETLPPYRTTVQPVNFRSYAHYFYLGTRSSDTSFVGYRYSVRVWRRTDNLPPDTIRARALPLFGYYALVDTLMPIMPEPWDTLE